MSDEAPQPFDDDELEDWRDILLSDPWSVQARLVLAIDAAKAQRDRAIQERDVSLEVASESFREALTGLPGLAELAGVTVTPDMANFRIQDAIAVQLKASHWSHAGVVTDPMGKVWHMHGDRIAQPDFGGQCFFCGEDKG